jgi:subtilase family serine protease
MALPQGYKAVAGSERLHPANHQALNPTADSTTVTATVIVRRTPQGKQLKKLEEFSAQSRMPRTSVSRAEFAASYGADPAEMAAVEAYEKSQGLEVIESNPSRRSVIVRGPATAMNKAFAVVLQDYDSPRGKYHGHTGPAKLPGPLADIVEAVIGLDNRKIPAQHFVTRKQPSDPPNTVAVTPQQVASFKISGRQRCRTNHRPLRNGDRKRSRRIRAFGYHQHHAGLRPPAAQDHRRLRRRRH